MGARVRSCWCSGRKSKKQSSDSPKEKMRKGSKELSVFGSLKRMLLKPFIRKDAQSNSAKAVQASEAPPPPPPPLEPPPPPLEPQVLRRPTGRQASQMPLHSAPPSREEVGLLANSTIAAESALAETTASIPAKAHAEAADVDTGTHLPPRSSGLLASNVSTGIGPPLPAANGEDFAEQQAIELCGSMSSVVYVRVSFPFPTATFQLVSCRLRFFVACVRCSLCRTEALPARGDKASRVWLKYRAT